MSATPPDPAEIAALLTRASACHDAADEAGVLAALDAALVLDPSNPHALNNRGLALRALGRTTEAADALAEAARRHPNAVHPHANLAATLLALHRPAEALRAAEAALRLAPHATEPANLAGGALLALDRPAEAIAWFSRALTADPAHPQARFGLAMALLTLGRWPEGFIHYEARWDDPAFTADEPVRAAPLWDGISALAGQRILLHAEQGLGDTIMAARFAPVLRAAGAYVVLAVQKPLIRLLAPLADAVVGREDASPPHDCRTPLMSLPRLLGATPNRVPGDVPYLFAEPMPDVRGPENSVGPGRHAGLVLSGSPDHPDDALRSIPAAACGALRRITDVTWHLLQPAVRDSDKAALAGWPALRRYDGRLGDFTDTARLVAAMDVVVSVDTSVAHLSGALGVPTMLFLQAAADWRWLRGSTTTAWYPSVQLVRQNAGQDWAAVMEVAIAGPGPWSGGRMTGATQASSAGSRP